MNKCMRDTRILTTEVGETNMYMRDVLFFRSVGYRRAMTLTNERTGFNSCEDRVDFHDVFLVTREFS